MDIIPLYTFSHSLMASLVKFTPINGCYQDYAPSSYLLEIDSFKILLDCGLPVPDSNGKFIVDDSYVKTLRRIVKTVDAVLLSHGDLLHCGALPVIINDLNPNAMIYATVPVHHLGLMTLYDLLQALEPFNSAPFGYDEVDLVFERIQKLRYSQPVNLSGSITVSPLPAGHTLGGSMWRIRKPPSEDILYTSAFNHKREAHLEGALFDAITRPSLMIVNAQQALAPAVIRKDRDSSLFASINSTLKGGGSVLIPVDSALRVLELAFVIDSGWNENIKSSLNHPVKAYLLTNQSYRTLEFAKGMLEWMSGTVMKVFDADRTNPFDFKHVNLVHSVEEISFTSPVIVLASSESLDFGHSHALLQQFGKSSSNCILAPFEVRPESLLAALLASAKLSEIAIKTWKKVPLEGEELAQFYAAEREEKERKAAEAAFAAFEKARREQGGGDFSNDLLGADDPALGADDDQNFSELLERQIDDANAFRNIFWVDYRNDWTIRTNSNDPINHLLSTPELLSNHYVYLGTAKNRFQSFPVREISKTVNEYGEVVFASEFEAPGGNIAKQEKAPVENKIKTKAKDSQETTAAVPFKWACKTVSIPVKCSRKSIPGFSGLSDGRSLKTIISRINPRKLLIVGGSSDATGFLLNHYRMSSEGIEAHAPKIHESINVSSSLNLLSAVISEALLNQLRVAYAQDYEVAHLNAKVRIKEHEMQDDTETTETVYELVPAPLSAIQPCPSIVIGDVKLSELRRSLSINHSSIKTEFTSSGDLICNGKVLVKKDQTSGQLFLEGPLCKEYYQIRNLFYKNVTMV